MSFFQSLHTFILTLFCVILAASCGVSGTDSTSGNEGQFRWPFRSKGERIVQKFATQAGSRALEGTVKTPSEAGLHGQPCEITFSNTRWRSGRPHFSIGFPGADVRDRSSNSEYYWHKNLGRNKESVRVWTYSGYIPGGIPYISSESFYVELGLEGGTLAHVAYGDSVLGEEGRCVLNQPLAITP